MHANYANNRSKMCNNIFPDRYQTKARDCEVAVRCKFTTVISEPGQVKPLFLQAAASISLRLTLGLGPQVPVLEGAV